jgi:NADP-dependent aldehyde dehydrogenase
MSLQPILIAGQWRQAQVAGTFRAENPATGEMLPDEFPVSAWADCDAALNSATAAAAILRATPPEQIAVFLTRYAERIEARKSELVEIAHTETALPKAPRLADVELPRTTNQLRQAAAALEGSWALPTIDSKLNLRSMLAPLGPVLVFGPNNFPFAYNGVAGGDFAAAIATGNPVIAKVHPCHPGTSRFLAEEAIAAVHETKLPPGTVQMIYQLAPEDGLRLASEPRLGAVGFTGSRAAGLKLKAAADVVGKPVYLELSSLNPVIILPGVLAERSVKIVEEFTGSCLLAGGQFCTNPGLVILLAGAATEQFTAAVAEKFAAAPVAPLLSAAVATGLQANVKKLQEAGAQIVIGGTSISGVGHRFANTLLRVSGEQFLAEPEKLQTEAFGNSSLFIIARDVAELEKIIGHFEGNLTGGIYSDTSGSDEALYEKLSPLLRSRVGRLLNDKMPTGVAVSAAMNHGGPFPATGHPGFTAVGFPASMRRFVALQCYDHVRPARLPTALRDKNPNGKMWRLIDGHWSQGDVTV